MRHRILISLFLIVICGFSPYRAADLFAQDIASRDTVLGNKYNLSQFGHETWSFIKQPTKWDGGDWLRLGVMGGATFLTMQVDQPIRDAVMRDNKRYFYSVPIEGARMYGELYSPFVFFIGFAAHSLIADDMSTRKIAYEIGQASLYTGAVVLTLKSIIGRARPHDDLGRATYHPFTIMGDDYHSLPGGHTATAFVISTVLSRNVHPTWLKVLVYLPAIITPISRVYQDMHWTSDNILGGAIGYFIATWVVDIHEQNDSRVHVSSIFPLTVSITLN
ncbi:MAG: phosphatase PAP2 family protein [Ignavibacteriales bacterium]|nr:phosphatase PAP2 family protein [Ignavibacteriales bacterium]